VDLGEPDNAAQTHFQPCHGAACRTLRCCSLLALLGTARPPFLESIFGN